MFLISRKLGASLCTQLREVVRKLVAKHAFGGVTHALKPEPARVHAGLPVALVPEKVAKSGDEPGDGLARRHELRAPLFGQDVGDLPLFGREQQCRIDVR